MAIRRRICSLLTKKEKLNHDLSKGGDNAAEVS